MILICIVSAGKGLVSGWGSCKEAQVGVFAYVV